MDFLEFIHPQHGSLFPRFLASSARQAANAHCDIEELRATTGKTKWMMSYSSPSSLAQRCPDRRKANCILPMRHRGDSNPCGRSPMDFESITLATRSQCLAMWENKLPTDLFSVSQCRSGHAPTTIPALRPVAPPMLLRPVRPAPRFPHSSQSTIAINRLSWARQMPGKAALGARKGGLSREALGGVVRRSPKGFWGPRLRPLLGFPSGIIR